jgi:tRNA dimethylallyltransferase
LDAGKVPVIVGPTAIGKTAVALSLSRHWPLEIISSDSRQIYRGLDVGTAKPSRRQQAAVSHHLIDVVRPGERYSAGRFARDAARVAGEIRQRGNLPVVVGGTGLYVRALAEGLFREPPLDSARRRSLDAWLARLESLELVRWAERFDPGFRGGGRQRASRAVEVAMLSGRPLSWWQREARASAGIRPWYVVLSAPRPVLHQRIAVRAAEMVRRGLLEEVAAAMAEAGTSSGPGFDGVGIREAVEALTGVRPRESVADAIAFSTRRYAKRQETWFRHQVPEPRLNLDATRPPEALAEDIAAAWDREQARGTE